MRIIDAEPVLDCIKKLLSCGKDLDDTEKLVSAFELGLNSVKAIVETASTIDPEELRPKGRWKRVEDSECYWYECSNCGEQPLKRYKYDCFSDYCPNCGAKMEEDP